MMIVREQWWHPDKGGYHDGPPIEAQHVWLVRVASVPHGASGVATATVCDDIAACKASLYSELVGSGWSGSIACVACTSYRGMVWYQTIRYEAGCTPTYADASIEGRYHAQSIAAMAERLRLASPVPLSQTPPIHLTPDEASLYV